MTGTGLSAAANVCTGLFFGSITGVCVSKVDMALTSDAAVWAESIACEASENVASGEKAGVCEAKFDTPLSSEDAFGTSESNRKCDAAENVASGDIAGVCESIVDK